MLKKKIDASSGETLIYLDGKWEKFSVYQLVLDRIIENLDSVRRLDWFDLSQLLGDASWDYLGTRGWQGRARYCFRYLIKKGVVPIEDVTKHYKNTKQYRVTN
jgi:hypothetical protein